MTAYFHHVDGLVVEVADVAAPPKGSGWLVTPAGVAPLPLWTWDGTKLSPPAASTLVYVPQTITRLEALAALSQMPGSAAGKSALDDANALVAGADTLTKLAWSEAGDFTRGSPLLGQMAIKLWGAAASATLDQVFISGARVVI